MSIDEGYIKYRGNWSAAAPIDADVASLLDSWRRPLHEAGLVGHYDELGIGYGNLSTRADASTFYISGTQTGHLSVTDGRHYALVTAYDIEQNSVDCVGPVQASSESLTHAAIYELDPGINGIVHVHSQILWHKLIDKLPATGSDVPYGTPEMANEFERLYRETPFADIGIAIMAGHEAGLVSIGEDLEQATLRILDLAREFA
jgi:hypothetical protein